ncbi:nuclear transport factor 2 family protein [Gordonia sp. (in: high G+C Gram-positive bacteria)]|uniref:nuclear transport factor 2 family protein n=1 Tax=Gordonia sp. (in: high G+C Gram-positive bacteria) TaxID=84139 RepID=UPI0016AA45CD|nr:nuclear transport factor 2 family protein [Gordonia sp. (in: high G+C Gram-positive bacteria)]NLG47693.1 nuclear transport factor 2 family protein [Gordonia sp. (in: high G+C Gram-positive bacteria)]
MSADDIRAIETLKYRYLRAVDTKDWAGLEATLTADVRTDYGSQFGGQPLTFPDRASVLAYFRKAMGGTLVSEHHVGHPIIEIDAADPTVATGSWYLQDRVIVPDHDVMIIGAAFYEDTYRKTDDGWRISSTGYQRTFEATSKLSATGFHLTRGAALPEPGTV